MNTQIKGNMAVTRKADIGGTLTVLDDARIAGNLRVEGWLDAKHLRVPCKGLFAHADALTEAFPRPLPGWWALVGDSVPAEIYRSEGGAWMATGHLGGELYVDLAYYDSRLVNLSDAIENIPQPIITADTPAADLVIADSQQRPILRIADGHIRTARFDSSAISVKAAVAAEHAHFSIDDVLGIIDLLRSSTAFSLWDIPFFGWLKSLHDRYGTTISLFCQNTTQMSGVKDQWRDQLREASSWLKFGFHNHTTGCAFSASASEAEAYWEEFVAETLRFAGTPNAIDRCPRLDYFSGSREALTAMRDASLGAKGFLAADDSRPSYCLSTEACEWLRHGADAVVDAGSALTFFRTDYRFDWLKSGWSSTNTPHWIPLAANAYDDLALMYADPRYKDTFRLLCMFCHETEVLSSDTGRRWVEDGCRWVADNALTWTFPQHLISDIRSM